MRKRVLVATLAALGVAFPVFAGEEHAAAFCKSALEKIPAVEEPCGKPPEGAGAGTVLVCARTKMDFDAFSGEWEKTIAQLEGMTPPPKAASDWLTEAGGRIRWYTLGDKYVVATFDSVTRQVMLAYARDKEGVFPIGKGVTPPRRVQVGQSAEARQEARAGVKAGSKGVVVLSAVIRRDGTVNDVEVLGCVPKFRGLEQAAISTIKKWRYEPAKLDGSPVDVTMTATFTYGPGGIYRASESADYTRSDSGQPAPGGMGPH